MIKCKYFVLAYERSGIIKNIFATNPVENAHLRPGRHIFGIGLEDKCAFVYIQDPLVIILFRTQVEDYAKPRSALFV